MSHRDHNNYSLGCYVSYQAQDNQDTFKMLSEFKKGRPSGSHKIQFNSPYRILAKNNNKGGMLTSKNLKQ